MGLITLRLGLKPARHRDRNANPEWKARLSLNGNIMQECADDGTYTIRFPDGEEHDGIDVAIPVIIASAISTSMFSTVAITAVVSRCAQIRFAFGGRTEQGEGIR